MTNAAVDDISGRRKHQRDQRNRYAYIAPKAGRNSRAIVSALT
jgi:hypothetical protein